MTSDEVKKIGKIVGSEIRKALIPVNKKLDEHTRILDAHSEKLDDHTKKLDRHSEKLDALFLDMVDVQKKTDLIPDLGSYIKNTKEKVDDLEHRVERLETAA